MSEVDPSMTTTEAKLVTDVRVMAGHSTEGWPGIILTFYGQTAAKTPIQVEQVWLDAETGVAVADTMIELAQPIRFLNAAPDAA